MNEDITRSIQGIKVGLCGDAEHDASPDVITQIANEVYAQDILGLIVSHLSQLDFEVRLVLFPSLSFISCSAWRRQKETMLTQCSGPQGRRNHIWDPPSPTTRSSITNGGILVWPARNPVWRFERVGVSCRSLDNQKADP